MDRSEASVGIVDMASRERLVGEAVNRPTSGPHPRRVLSRARAWVLQALFCLDAGDSLLVRSGEENIGSERINESLNDCLIERECLVLSHFVSLAKGKKGI